MSQPRRLHSVKGWQWAVRGARRAGQRLVVAGGWKALLYGARVVGPVGGARKANLLAGAACLWMPARWDEPFGLTLIEGIDPEACRSRVVEAFSHRVMAERYLALYREVMAGGGLRER